MEQAIIEFIKSASGAVTIAEAIDSTGASKGEILRTFRGEVDCGNIEYTYVKGPKGSTYEWIGPISPHPMTGVDIEAVSLESLESAAYELAGLPKEPLAEPEEQEIPPLAPPLPLKTRYLIKATKDKMATANSESQAKRIARRFVNEGHKRVEISTTQLHAVAKQGVEVERV